MIAISVAQSVPGVCSKCGLEALEMCLRVLWNRYPTPVEVQYTSC